MCNLFFRQGNDFPDCRVLEKQQGQRVMVHTLDLFMQFIALEFLLNLD